MKKALIYIIMVFTLPVYGQVSFQFIPEMYGRNVDGLFNCRILNSVTRRSATLSIVVSERKYGAVVLIKTAPFTIAPGSNIIPMSAIRNASIQYANNNIAVVSRNHDYFPEGNYEYCFTLNFTDNSNQALAEQCFNYQLTPFAELNLINPYDKDKICDTRPTLTWQPLIPGINGAYYQLVISEIKTGQTPVEALNYNLPLINQSNITATMLPFPSIVKELEKGKRYVWQVTAYKNQTVLNRSEVWEFKVECQDTPVKKITDDGYRDIEDLVKGNYYIANGEIRFAVINAYNDQKLKYEIKSLNETNKSIKGLPKLKLTRGSNKIIIDLSTIGALIDGNFYIMNMWLPNGTVKSLRFIYYEKN